MYNQNAEIIHTEDGYWVNLDKSCCVPITEKGEVVYFKTKEQAAMAISNDEAYVNKLIELTDNINQK